MQVPLSIYNFAFPLNNNSRFPSAPAGAAALGWALTQGDAVWPLDVVGDQHAPPHAVQTGLLNLGFVSPVRPVHEPDRGTGKKAISWTPAKNPALLIALRGAKGTLLITAVNSSGGTTCSSPTE